MTPAEQQSRQQTRQTLLDELESIRGLLHAPPEASAAGDNEPPLLEIPVLQETVTTAEGLSPDPFAAIPVLHERDTGDISAPAAIKNPLDDVRVAALAVRSSRSNTAHQPDTRTTVVPHSSPNKPTPDHDALVQSILDALRPELEQLLHKVLAEQLSGQPNTPPRKP